VLVFVTACKPHYRTAIAVFLHFQENEIEKRQGKIRPTQSPFYHSVKITVRIGLFADGFFWYVSGRSNRKANLLNLPLLKIRMPLNSKRFVFIFALDSERWRIRLRF